MWVSVPPSGWAITSSCQHKAKKVKLVKMNQKGAVHILAIVIVFLISLILLGLASKNNKSDIQNQSNLSSGFGKLLETINSAIKQSPTPTLNPTPTTIPTSQPTSTPTTKLTPRPTATSTPSPTSAPNSNFSSRKVLVLIFNPVVESAGSKKLVDLKGWNNPLSLSNSYINDLKNLTNNFVNYSIVETKEIDGVPTYEDGFVYSDESLLGCLNNPGTCHQPWTANYQKILSDYGVCEKRNRGDIDEVWLWGGPYFGYYESRLAGPNAFFYNSPPLNGTTCLKQLPIMGFNYERGVSEMLEDIAHRTESVMDHVYGSHQSSGSGPWGKFMLRDIDSSGNAGCGSIHFGPNGTSDYNWSNTRFVYSQCDDWYNYPNLTGNKKYLNCSEWGCNGYEFKKWWIKHIPKANGKTSGKLNNWWKYVLDYESAVSE